MAVFGPKLQFLKPRSATCGNCSKPPPLSFLIKPCVVVPHTHMYHPPKFQRDPKHHDGILIFPHFARAAACLLAAAKPGRSTLDPKKGYTSSVTLIKTQYWDRAGGVMPMVLYVLGWRKVNWGCNWGLGDGV